MSTHYDSISADYARSKLAPWREFVERVTLFDLLGAPAGLSILDLACGSGFYSRLLRAAGAARVVGVDLSAGMIELARRDETTEPLGITYHVADAMELALNDTFDVVFAAYLFNYAQTADELAAMCRAVVRHLKPSGRLVAVVNNPEQSPPGWEAIRKYGYVKSAALPLTEGAAITHTMFPPGGGTFVFDNYYLSLPTHHRVFHATGLQEVSWHLPRLSADGEAAYGQGYWDDFLADPPVIFLTAHTRGPQQVP
jgi:ubiquinone/menaquinone biosynthesis C-methylase UbiE